MASNLIHYEEYQKDDLFIWSIIGSLDMTTAQEAEDKGKIIVENNDKVVLDMSRMEYISSAGLRVLLILSQEAEDNDKEFILCGASGDVKEVLEDSGIDVLLNIVESLEEIE